MFKPEDKYNYLMQYLLECSEPLAPVIARKLMIYNEVPAMSLEELLEFDAETFDVMFQNYISSGRKPSRRPVLTMTYPWFGYVKGNVQWEMWHTAERKALRQMQLKDLVYPADNVHFVSDMHFMHKNIIFHNRPEFKDVEEMHESMIQNWNAAVKPDDLVFDLGDLTLGSMTKALPFLSRLNGFIIHLKGNHVSEQEWAYYDMHLPKQKFVDSSYMCVTLNQQKIALCHFPILSWDDMHKGSFHLFGHSHGSNLMEPLMGKAMDVGVDATSDITKGLRPVSLNEVADVMVDKPIVSWDHHEEGGN